MEAILFSWSMVGEVTLLSVGSLAAFSFLYWVRGKTWIARWAKYPILIATWCVLPLLGLAAVSLAKVAISAPSATQLFLGGIIVSECLLTYLSGRFCLKSVDLQTK